MFEDILSSAPDGLVNPEPLSEKPQEVKKKTPKPKMTINLYEMVKETDDLRMLIKILDLCKVKVRKQKKKNRKSR